MMNKRPSGLGRGLGSLIPQRMTPAPVAVSERPAAAAANNGPLTVAVTKIRVNSEQPRVAFRHQELEELMESIREHGIIQPLTVTPLDDGNFELIAGERRLRAAKMLGLTEVPVTIRRTDDRKNKLLLALIENIQRQDLNPMEEARSYNRLSIEFELTQEEIAKKVGKARSTVANLMRLLELPEVIQQAVAEGQVPPGTARAILAIKDDKRRLAFFKKLTIEKGTTRDAETGAKVAGGTRHHKDPSLAAAEDQIRQVLGARIEIRKRAGKGSITVSFYSEAEYSELVRRLSR